jgi:hypothetical protein
MLNEKYTLSTIFLKRYRIILKDIFINELELYPVNMKPAIAGVESSRKGRTRKIQLDLKVPDLVCMVFASPKLKVL